MATHRDKIGLIKESLLELIHVAEYAVKIKKTDPKEWGVANATGGILGFPSSVILFSIIDCLGSVFAGDINYKITIDNQQHFIKDTSQHIYILNSKYFNLDLSKIDLDNIYKNVRSTLIHNSLLPEGYYLQPGEHENSPFKIAITELDNRFYLINVIPLYTATKKAVHAFLEDIEKEYINFSKSTIYKNIKKRDTKTMMYYDPSKPRQYQIRIKKWIKE